MVRAIEHKFVDVCVGVSVKRRHPPTQLPTHLPTQRFPCPQRHRYHRECVGRYVPSALEQRKCPVPCAAEGCTGAMADAQVCTGWEESGRVDWFVGVVCLSMAGV